MHYPVFALVLISAAFAAAGSDSKIASSLSFAASFSPRYTYSMKYTNSNDECWYLCEEDEKCVLWTRLAKSGLCALKDDCDYLLPAVGCDTGVKYYGYGVPEVKADGLEITVIAGKGNSKPVPPPPAPQSNVVSASASSFSTGGTSSASVVATPHGVKSSSFVSGNGAAFTSATTPVVTLATALTKEHGELPDYVVKYYANPYIKTEVTLTTEKVVPFLLSEKEDDSCFYCDAFPCLYSKGVIYKSTQVLLETETDSQFGCCNLCRKTDLCVSWYRNPKSKKCVLNSDLPAVETKEAVYGGYLC